MRRPCKSQERIAIISKAIERDCSLSKGDGASLIWSHDPPGALQNNSQDLHRRIGRFISLTSSAGTLSEMPQDERGYLILPHELATGADCDGCLIVVERGDMVEIKCNSCGSVVDTVLEPV